MYWSFWGDLELLSEGWLMRALAGAGHGKRECVLLSGGVPTEGGGAGVSLPGQGVQALSSVLELGV